MPRILLVIRNAYGGAYACFNNYATGADVVLALPTARIAVMGLAGTQFVYKQKIQALQAQYADQDPELEASLLALDQDYTDRYLNANAALQVGAVSDLVSPLAVRRVLNQQLERLYKSYRVEPMSGLQREFF